MKYELRQNKVWSIDGTFYVCPSPYVQLYTVSIIIDHHVVPIVYALLPSKHERVYNEFLAILKRLIPRLNPEYIISDFEKSAINSFSKNFPNAVMSGCLFHLGQNIHKKIRANGYERLYSGDKNFKLFISALKCLAFVPLDWVRGTFNWLYRHPNFPFECREIYMYFWNTYIGYIDESCMFPIKFWSCIENIDKDIPRTNNAIEGWHAAFDKFFAAKNKRISHFCQRLKKEEEIVYQKLLRIKGGEKIARKKKYITVNKRLVEFLEKVKTEEKLPFEYIFKLTEYVFYGN